MAETKTIPTAHEIDELAKAYVDAKTAVEAAREKLEKAEEPLLAAVIKHGFVPARAQKTKRLLGEKWKCSASQSDSVEVDGTESLRYMAFLKYIGLPHLFSRLFRRRFVYVLNPRAQAILENYCTREKFEKHADKMRAGFNRCVLVNTGSERLSVEPIEKAKEAKAS